MRRLPSSLIVSSLCALALVPLVSCGPQPLEIRAKFELNEALARRSLSEQMPALLLARVGGLLPDVWPPTAPRLVLDVQLLSRARLDLGAAGIDTTTQSALRIKSVVAQVGALAGGALYRPQPTELYLFVGPLNATSLSDPGVKRFARGAFPAVAATPPDAGATDGGAADATPATAQNSLVLEPGALDALRSLVLGNGQLEFLLLTRLPVDTQAEPRTPRGGAQVDFTLTLELVP